MNLPVPAHDPAALAAFLAEHHLPGQRSMTAITRLRRQRRAYQAVPSNGAGKAGWRGSAPADRLRARITSTAIEEITRRGGETAIYGKHGRVNAILAIVDRDPRTRIVLLRAEGWRYYSQRFGFRYVAFAYVYGVDEAGPWAVRVPATMNTVRQAVRWMEPAAVAAAHADGRRVRRQGDIYAIETSAAHDGAGLENLPVTHHWQPATRYLLHRPGNGRRHRPLYLPYPVRFIRQRVLRMGRNGGRSYGD